MEAEDSYEDERKEVFAEEGMDPSSAVFFYSSSEEVADRREMDGVSVAAEYEDEEEASEARRNMDIDLDVPDPTKQVNLHIIPDKRNNTINEVFTLFDEYQISFSPPAPPPLSGMSSFFPSLIRLSSSSSLSWS